MTFNLQELKWLKEHGGRDVEDVEEDEKGKYITMYNGDTKRYEKHYLDDYI